MGVTGHRWAASRRETLVEWKNTPSSVIGFDLRLPWGNFFSSSSFKIGLFTKSFGERSVVDD